MSFNEYHTCRSTCIARAFLERIALKIPKDNSEEIPK